MVTSFLTVYWFWFNKRAERVWLCLFWVSLLQWRHFLLLCNLLLVQTVKQCTCFTLQDHVWSVNVQFNLWLLTFFGFCTPSAGFVVCHLFRHCGVTVEFTIFLLLKSIMVEITSSVWSGCIGEWISNVVCWHVCNSAGRRGRLETTAADGACHHQRYLPWYSNCRRQCSSGYSVGFHRPSGSHLT